MNKLRFDAAPIAARIDSDGFLYATVNVGRTGILHYRNADGTPRRELRLPEEAGSSATLESMRGKPIVVLHKGKMVDKYDAKGRVVGAMLAARHDSVFTQSDIVVHAGEGIKGVQDGTTPELSLGYRLDLEPRSGYYRADTNEISDTPREGFEPFDFIQRNLRVNHLALVPSGRAGSQCRINLDGDQDIFENEDLPTMRKIKLANGTEVEVADEVAQHVEGIQTRLDGATSEVSTTKGTLLAVTAERDQLKGEVAGFEAKLTQARLDAAEELKASDVLAKSVAHKVTVTAGMTDTQVKSAFIKAVMPTINLDGMDDATIHGAFVGAMTANPATEADKGKQQQQQQHFNGGKENLDGADKGEKSGKGAEARYLDRLFNRKPGGAQ